MDSLHHGSPAAAFRALLAIVAVVVIVLVVVVVVFPDAADGFQQQHPLLELGDLSLHQEKSLLQRHVLLLELRDVHVLAVHPALQELGGRPVLLSGVHHLKPAHVVVQPALDLQVFLHVALAGRLLVVVVFLLAGPDLVAVRRPETDQALHGAVAVDAPLLLDHVGEVLARRGELGRREDRRRDGAWRDQRGDASGLLGAEQVPDRIDSMEPLSLSTTDTEQKPVDVDNSNKQKPVVVDIAKKQSPSIKDEKVITFDASHNSKNMDITRDMQGNLGSFDAVGDNNMVYPQVTFAPQAQYFYGGYENPTIDWEGHSRLLNLESLDVGQTGVYNENPSLVYPGYGYIPQMLYGSYSPVMTPLPSISGDGQLYSTQQFQFSDAYYQQPSPTNIPNISSAIPISQADWTMPINQQGSFPADTLNFNANLFSPTPGYHLSYDSSGGDWLRFSEGTGSATPLLSSAASPQPIGALSFGQSTMPFGLGSLQSSYGFGSSAGPLERGYPPGIYHSNRYGTSFPNSKIKDQGAVDVQKGRRRGLGNALLCSCNGTLDFLNEQNRGPRANRKNQMTEKIPLSENPNNSSGGIDHNLYNSPDFVTEYKDAKFFIIKSYTEDNVHKSIKYGVWASTSNGNRKLDSTYHEAKKKEDPCPVFLFFSVNASAQFCGVAEMIEPVDFEKSVDYWQQDKWNGQFPVKWHIVKDVPNNLFRHITLENNDNKPVTNSRDTQEVKLEQGLEMLSIFKKHEYEASILDDFEFYEEREKAMQERKALQHQLSNSARSVPAAFRDEQRNPSSFINQISKNFAHALRLEERDDADLSKDKNNSLSIGISPNSDDMIKPATAIVTTSN